LTARDSRGARHAIDKQRKARGLSASTISNYLKPLSGTLALAVRRGYIASNPYRNLTGDERPVKSDFEPAHEWTDDEIQSLLGAAQEIAEWPESQYDYTPLLRVAVYTGLRLGELLGLQWRDVDFEAGVLHVRRQYTVSGELAPPKTRKGLRRVPLSPELVASLRLLKVASHFSQDDSPVFASRTGSPLGHRNVQRRGFERARDSANLPKTLSFHDLRHAFASMAAHRGVPIGTLSEVLGHADVGVTQRVYTHLYDREASEEAFRAAMSGGAS